MGILKQNRNFLVAVLIISLLLSAVSISFIEESKNRSEQERVSYIAANQASKIQTTINSLLQKTQTLKLLVIQGKGEIEGFDKVAQELIDSSAITSLQLAPNGIVDDVYPPGANTAEPGDLFLNLSSSKAAAFAKNSEKLTMSGPSKLSDDKLGIIGRLPIFLENAGGAKSFWGFSVIVIDFADVLKIAGLEQLTQDGFDYKLSHINAETGSKTVLSETSKGALPSPVVIPFSLPNVTWTISLAPQKGWIHIPDLIWEIALGIFLSFLLTSLSFALISLHAQKSDLRQLAVTDTLTGLANRRKLQEALDSRCRDREHTFMLCYMDLNDFKSINDNLGHNYGDLLLQECARRLRVCMRQGDLLFRVGGDEFIAIIENLTTPEMFQERVDAITQRIAAPFTLDRHTIRSSISVGYAVYPRDAADSEELLRRADDSMYAVKARNKKNSQALDSEQTG